MNKRVVRGYKYDHILVVDGLAYSCLGLREAAFSELEAAGLKNSAYHAPPFFYTGCPYPEQIKALAARHGIEGAPPPVDMDAASVCHDGREPAFASREWCRVFKCDPSLHWFEKML